MKWWWVMSAVVAGCVQSNSVTCPDGRTCPEGRLCAEVKPTDDAHADAPPDKLCVAPAQFTVCDGKDPLAECASDAVPAGRCYDGVCLPAGCGNDRVDPDEACDDANSVVGDGCSYACQSVETCGNGLVDPVHLDLDGLPLGGDVCDDGGRLGHDGCTGTCQPEAPDWVFLTTGAPPLRNKAAMAYDALHGRIVMLGGSPSNGAGASSDTWIYDGVGWLRLATPVDPPPRVGATMTYDSKRQRVVVFGGSGGGFMNDLWELDGDTWRELTPTTGTARPPGRLDSAMVFDATRDRLVVYGGDQGMQDVLNDTWEWDGSAWTQVSGGTQPGARWGHTMVFDPIRGVTVMAGGSSDTNTATAVQGTWEYDGTWRMALGTSPGEFLLSAGAFDPVLGKPVVFGGQGGNSYQNKTFSWSGTAWTQLGGTAGPPRTMMSVAMDSRRGRLVLFGGNNSGAFPLADTWERSASGWAQITTTVPDGRMLYAFATDQRRHRFVIFGGMKAAFGSMLGDTWTFDGTSWQQGPSGPTGRWAPAMAADTKRGEIVLFGGYDSAGMQGDTWIWNGMSWAVKPSSAPPGRWNHAMAYDAKRDRVVMFGGTTASGDSADTWEWNGTTWLDVTPAPGATSPSDRNGHAMAYDPVRERVILVGGGSDEDGETWEWDGASWTSIDSTSAVPKRQGPALAWNHARGTMMMFSGRGAASDTFERRGTEWTQVVTQNHPEERFWGGMAPSPDGSGVILFGGYDESPTGSGNGIAELSAFRYVSATESYEACAGTSDDDADGDAGCADPDCWARCTPSCPPGAACDTAAPRCGDGTCAAGVEDCRVCPGDCTCTPACGDGFCDPGETAAMCPGDC